MCVFSPTDLVGAALGSCVLTLMGIVAKKLKIDIKGTHVTVVKEMALAPSRRIGKLTMTVKCPFQFPPDVAQKLITAAEGCPVHHSLHPDIEQEFIFLWGVS